MAGANDFFVEDFFPDEVPGVPGFRRLTESTPEMNVYRPMTPEVCIKIFCFHEFKKTFSEIIVQFLIF